VRRWAPANQLRAAPDDLHAVSFLADFAGWRGRDAAARGVEALARRSHFTDKVSELFENTHNLEEVMIPAPLTK
jgi:hypothetical protein